jgi:hypothetical protein
MSKSILQFPLHFFSFLRQNQAFSRCIRHLASNPGSEGYHWGTQTDYDRQFKRAPAGDLFSKRKNLTPVLALLCHTPDYGTSTANAALD